MLTVLLSSQCSSFAAFTEATDPFITSGLTDSSILRCWQLLPLILLILWFKYVIVFISDDIPSNLCIHLTWVPQPRNLQATLFSMCVSQPWNIQAIITSIHNVGFPTRGNIHAIMTSIHTLNVGFPTLKHTGFPAAGNSGFKMDSTLIQKSPFKIRATTKMNSAWSNALHFPLLILSCYAQASRFNRVAAYSDSFWCLKALGSKQHQLVFPIKSKSILDVNVMDLACQWTVIGKNQN